jgi:hypothetical protein
MVLKNKKPSNIVIGCVYGQTISGTIFRYEVLEYKGCFHNEDYYLVRNIETGHRMKIQGSELHIL